MKYDYTYYPKIRILVSDSLGITWDLTEREHEFLMLLIEKEFVSKEEMSKTLTGEYSEKKFNVVKQIKSRLCLNTFIEIKTKNNCGYRLLSRIELKERCK